MYDQYDVESYVLRMFNRSEFPLFGKYQVNVYEIIWYGDTVESIVAAICEYKGINYEKTIQDET